MSPLPPRVSRPLLPRRQVLGYGGTLGLLSLGGAGLSWAAATGANTRVLAPTDLRIGFQKSAIGLVLLKQRGILESKLPGTQVRWIEFPAGPQLLEALAVGSIDVGMTGDSPPVFAQAAGKDMVYVGAEPPKPDASAILVRPDRPISQLPDLKGKKIAFQKGSSAHYLVVRALEKAGLGWSDIEPVYLPPADARAAFERGAVDAWAVWDPYYAAAEITGQVRVLTNGRGLSNNNSFYLASQGFTHDYPGVLQTLFAALTEADQFLQAHRKEAAALYADFSGLNLSTVHRVLSRRSPSPVDVISPALIQDQQRVADSFARLGLIPRPISVASAVWQPSQPVALAR